MRYPVLITDYDGTLAEHGEVAPAAVDALERLRDSGRRLVLATGRQLEDLRAVFPRLDAFDYVTAENGAVLFRPADGEITLLAPPPPPSFPRRLADAGVKPLSLGRVIVATNLRWQTEVRAAIRESGVPLQISLNKGAVMILPAGVDKAHGTRAALLRLGLEMERAIGIGDAENDECFLRACGTAVAVADAVEPLRRFADRVTKGGAGAGVVEVIDHLLAGR